MKEVEFFDADFLGNKIEIGDKVIFGAPKYRDVTIGTVISKASKFCQIEYINDWNYPGRGRKEVVRQFYGQLFKYPIAKESKWIEHIEKPDWLEDDVEVYYECSCCGINNFAATPYCPSCGSKMIPEN